MNTEYFARTEKTGKRDETECGHVIDNRVQWSPAEGFCDFNSRQFDSRSGPRRK